MENILKLITDFEFCEDEAQASVFSKNKNVSHAKFVFTDDLPNANKQRVPQEEFDNIIATGTFMPIKMSAGKINDGHEESVPLGVISHLKQDGNKVIGLATLWLAERTEDINHLKEMVKENKSPQLSWELLYTNSTINDDTGIEDLHDIAVRASTIVGLPAYSGRTPILAISSKAENNSEEIKVEEELKARIAELETELTTLKETLSQKDTELASLKEFKSAIELKDAEEQKLASIKTKFGEAKISKPEEYFTENREQLLKLDENSLDFMIQELIAYSTVVTAQAGKKPDLPQLPTSETEVKFNTTKEIATALLEQLAKK